jgi:hypothetical protein
MRPPRRAKDGAPGFSSILTVTAKKIINTFALTAFSTF